MAQKSLDSKPEAGAATQTAPDTVTTDSTRTEATKRPTLKTTDVGNREEFARVLKQITGTGASTDIIRQILGGAEIIQSKQGDKSPGNKPTCEQEKEVTEQKTTTTRGKDGDTVVKNDAGQEVARYTESTEDDKTVRSYSVPAGIEVTLVEGQPTEVKYDTQNRKESWTIDSKGIATRSGSSGQPENLEHAQFDQSTGCIHGEVSLPNRNGQPENVNLTINPNGTIIETRTAKDKDGTEYQYTTTRDKNGHPIQLETPGLKDGKVEPDVRAITRFQYETDKDGKVVVENEKPQLKRMEFSVESKDNPSRVFLTNQGNGKWVQSELQFKPPGQLAAAKYERSLLDPKQSQKPFTREFITPKGYSAIVERDSSDQEHLLEIRKEGYTLAKVGEDGVQEIQKLDVKGDIHVKLDSGATMSIHEEPGQSWNANLHIEHDGTIKFIDNNNIAKEVEPSGETKQIAPEPDQNDAPKPEEMGAFTDRTQIVQVGTHADGKKTWGQGIPCVMTQWGFDGYTAEKGNFTITRMGDQGYTYTLSQQLAANGHIQRRETQFNVQNGVSVYYRDKQGTMQALHHVTSMVSELQTNGTYKITYHVSGENSGNPQAPQAVIVNTTLDGRYVDDYGIAISKKSDHLPQPALQSKANNGSNPASPDTVIKLEQQLRQLNANDMNQADKLARKIIEEQMRIEDEKDAKARREGNELAQREAQRRNADLRALLKSDAQGNTKRQELIARIRNGQSINTPQPEAPVKPTVPPTPTTLYPPDPYSPNPIPNFPPYDPGVQPYDYDPNFPQPINPVPGIQPTYDPNFPPNYPGVLPYNPGVLPYNPGILPYDPGIRPPDICPPGGGG